MQIQVVILTKSAKFGKFCVAGIDVNTGEWIRLTSNDGTCHGAIDGRYLRYLDGTICNVLDVVAVSNTMRNPQRVQPENYLVDESSKLNKIDEMTIDDVIAIHPCEKHIYIFGNQYCCVREQNINAVGRSLTLVEVRRLVLTRQANNVGASKTKASFIYEGAEYNNISVTDPEFFHLEADINYENGTSI